MSMLLALGLLAVSQSDPPKAIPEVLSALETAVSDAIAYAQPSVVAIARIRNTNGGETTAIRGAAPRPPANAEGFAAQDPLASLDQLYALPGDFASGAVIGERGEILTTYHSLKGAAQIVVRAPGRQLFTAEIIAADPRSDLAVIAPVQSALGAVRLRPIRMGKAESLRQGSFLIALGNAYNAARDDGKASASWGILSNKARRIEPPVGEELTTRQYFRYQPTLLQLDAKLNQSMSGGPVINLKGELVGITTTAASPAGFDVMAGYAIPLDELGRRAARTLATGKEVEYGFLGIGLRRDVPNGIERIEEGSPAWRASLTNQDVIIKVGDENLEPTEDGLSLALSRVPVGESVKLRVRNNEGKERDVAIFISKYPPLPETIATNRPPHWRGMRVDYASVIGASQFGGDALQAMAKGNVGVVDVETSSPAEAAGLRRGMVITHVGGKAIKNPAEFYQAVQGQKGPVSLTTELGPEAGMRVTVKQ